MDAGSDREYVVTKSMTLEMGEMYGSVEALVKLDGVASGSDSTIRIVDMIGSHLGLNLRVKWVAVT